MHSFIRLAALVAVLLTLTGARLIGSPAEGSVIRYTARDQVSSWTGEAPVQALEIHFKDTDISEIELTVQVDPAEFRSGNGVRDGQARREVFEVDRFPAIVFEGDAVAGDRLTLPFGGERQLQVSGELSLHGITRPLTVEVMLQRQGDLVTVQGGFEVLLSDFEMSRPRFLALVTDDAVQVEFDLVIEVTPE